MSELPISKKEYECSALMADFIVKLKKYNCNNDIYDMKFCPKIKGYEILFEADNNHIKISLKRNLLNGLNIKKYINGRFQKGYSYKSYSPQDNEDIINKIMQ